MALPSFDFLYIVAGDGKTGTSGDALQNSWTYNFDTIKNLITILDNDVQKRILSNEIQQIKVENGVASFTTDNGKTWQSLGPSFANITGNPDDCPALVAKFKNYATTVDMDNVKDRLSAAEADIVMLDNSVTLMDSDIADIKNTLNNASTGVLVRLSKVEVDLQKKITSQSVIEIKEVEEGALQYTTNGTDWYPVAAALGIDWGVIGGNIENQADLMNEFDKINDLVATVTTDLENHTQNFNNPHGVTAEQIGLGNVDNTSDTDKPVSTAQQAAIDAAINEAVNAVKVRAINTQTYEDLEVKDTNTIYLITDQTQ